MMKHQKDCFGTKTFISVFLDIILLAVKLDIFCFSYMFVYIGLHGESEHVDVFYANIGLLLLEVLGGMSWNSFDRPFHELTLGTIFYNDIPSAAEWHLEAYKPMRVFILLISLSVLRQNGLTPRNEKLNFHYIFGSV